MASCTFSAPAKSIWSAYIPSANGAVTADTFGSNFDTVLVAYTGASLGGLTEVACDDDSGGGSLTPDLRSTRSPARPTTSRRVATPATPATSCST